jgi:hypothetical protein
MIGLGQVSIWIQILANAAILIALIFTAYQIRLSSKANEATLLKDLFDKNAELRKQFNQLRNKIPLYEELIEKYLDPLVLRSLEELEPLFQIGHHYEYIGILVKYKFMNLNMIFALIPVDKEIWVKSEPIQRHLRQQWLPD